MYMVSNNKIVVSLYGNGSAMIAPLIAYEFRFLANCISYMLLRHLQWLMSSCHDIQELNVH